MSLKQTFEDRRGFKRTSEATKLDDAIRKNNQVHEEYAKTKTRERHKTYINNSGGEK